MEVNNNVIESELEFIIELDKFYNIDLFLRGFYQVELDFKLNNNSTNTNNQNTNGFDHGHHTSGGANNKSSSNSSNHHPSSAGTNSDKTSLSGGSTSSLQIGNNSLNYFYHIEFVKLPNNSAGGSSKEKSNKNLLLLGGNEKNNTVETLINLQQTPAETGSSSTSSSNKKLKKLNTASANTTSGGKDSSNNYKGKDKDGGGGGQSKMKNSASNSGGGVEEGKLLKTKQFRILFRNEEVDLNELFLIKIKIWFINLNFHHLFSNHLFNQRENSNGDHYFFTNNSSGGIPNSSNHNKLIEELIYKLEYILEIRLLFNSEIVSQRNLNLFPNPLLNYHRPIFFDYFHLSAFGLTIHGGIINILLLSPNQSSNITKLTKENKLPYHSEIPPNIYNLIINLNLFNGSTSTSSGNLKNENSSSNLSSASASILTDDRNDHFINSLNFENDDEFLLFLFPYLIISSGTKGVGGDNLSNSSKGSKGHQSNFYYYPSLSQTGDSNKNNLIEDFDYLQYYFDKSNTQSLVFGSNEDDNGLKFGCYGSTQNNSTNSPSSSSSSSSTSSAASISNMNNTNSSTSTSAYSSLIINSLTSLTSCANCSTSTAPIQQHATNATNFIPSKKYSTLGGTYTANNKINKILNYYTNVLFNKINLNFASSAEGEFLIGSKKNLIKNINLILNSIINPPNNSNNNNNCSSNNKITNMINLINMYNIIIELLNTINCNLKCKLSEFFKVLEIFLFNSSQQQQQIIQQQSNPNFNSLNKKKNVPKFENNESCYKNYLNNNPELLANLNISDHIELLRCNCNNLNSTICNGPLEDPSNEIICVKDSTGRVILNLVFTLFNNNCNGNANNEICLVLNSSNDKIITSSSCAPENNNLVLIKILKNFFNKLKLLLIKKRELINKLNNENLLLWKNKFLFNILNSSCNSNNKNLQIVGRLEINNHLKLIHHLNRKRRFTEGFYVITNKLEAAFNNFNYCNQNNMILNSFSSIQQQHFINSNSSSNSNTNSIPITTSENITGLIEILKKSIIYEILPITCFELDGDETNIPIIFEQRFVSSTSTVIDGNEILTAAKDSLQPKFQNPLGGINFSKSQENILLLQMNEQNNSISTPTTNNNSTFTNKSLLHQSNSTNSLNYLFLQQQKQQQGKLHNKKFDLQKENFNNNSSNKNTLTKSGKTGSGKIKKKLQQDNNNRLYMNGFTTWNSHNHHNNSNFYQNYYYFQNGPNNNTICTCNSISSLNSSNINEYLLMNPSGKQNNFTISATSAFHPPLKKEQLQQQQQQQQQAENSKTVLSRTNSKETGGENDEILLKLQIPPSVQQTNLNVKLKSKSKSINNLSNNKENENNEDDEEDDEDEDCDIETGRVLTGKLIINNNKIIIGGDNAKNNLELKKSLEEKYQQILKNKLKMLIQENHSCNLVNVNANGGTGNSGSKSNTPPLSLSNSYKSSPPPPTATPHNSLSNDEGAPVIKSNNNKCNELKDETLIVKRQFSNDSNKSNHNGANNLTISITNTNSNNNNTNASIMDKNSLNINTNEDNRKDFFANHFSTSLPRRHSSSTTPTIENTPSFFAEDKLSNGSTIPVMKMSNANYYSSLNRGGTLPLTNNSSSNKINSILEFNISGRGNHSSTSGGKGNKKMRGEDIVFESDKLQKKFNTSGNKSGGSNNNNNKNTKKSKKSNNIQSTEQEKLLLLSKSTPNMNTVLTNEDDNVFLDKVNYYNEDETHFNSLTYYVNDENFQYGITTQKVESLHRKKRRRSLNFLLENNNYKNFKVDIDYENEDDDEEEEDEEIRISMEEIIQIPNNESNKRERAPPKENENINKLKSSVSESQNNTSGGFSIFEPPPEFKDDSNLKIKMVDEVESKSENNNTMMILPPKEFQDKNPPEVKEVNISRSNSRKNSVKKSNSGGSGGSGGKSSTSISGSSSGSNNKRLIVKSFSQQGEKEMGSNRKLLGNSKSSNELNKQSAGQLEDSSNDQMIKKAYTSSASNVNAENVLLMKELGETELDREKTKLRYLKKLENYYESINYYFKIPDELRIFDPKGVHLIVCVHGLDGSCHDLRLFRVYLEISLPGDNLQFLMSEKNQDGQTFASFEDMTDKLVNEILSYINDNNLKINNPNSTQTTNNTTSTNTNTSFPTNSSSSASNGNNMTGNNYLKRISFIGHSLGNIIIRSALNRPELAFLHPKLHTFLSLSGPHLGTIYLRGIVNMGMWIMQKWKKSSSLLQLSMKDAADIRQTYLYKLSKNSSNMDKFKYVLLCGSWQDRYVPINSAHITHCKLSLKDHSQIGEAYREMVSNLLNPILTNSNLIRYDVHHNFQSTNTTVNNFIGRAAHVAFLDSEIFIEKFLSNCIQYFQ